MTPQLTFGAPKLFNFAIKIPVRNAMGEETGRFKEECFQTGAELCEWYDRNTFKAPSKRRRKKKKK